MTTSRGDQISNLGTRHLIVQILAVDVWHINARIIVLVRSGKADEILFLGHSVLIATNLHLRARWVELCPVSFICEVKGKDLMTKEIISCFEVRRNLKIERFSCLEIGLIPVSAVLLPLLINLEPLGSRGIEIRARLISTRCHIGDHWAVEMRPLTSLCRYTRR